METTATHAVDGLVQVQIADLDLASVLVSLGCTRLLGHVLTREPGRHEFVLTGDRDLVASLTARFAMGDLLVEPRAFAAGRGLTGSSSNDRRRRTAEFRRSSRLY